MPISIIRLCTPSSNENDFLFIVFTSLSWSPSSISSHFHFSRFHFPGKERKQRAMTILVVIAAIWSLLLRWVSIRIRSYCRLPSCNQPRVTASLLHSSGRFDPFSLVSDDLSVVTERLRVMEMAEQFPEIASAVRYYFKPGTEGKMFRPAVASLIHDDILDDADTRRSVPSLNVVSGNKIAVLAGDFLLSQANTALATLGNTEVMSLFATVVQNLIKGESMQANTSSDQRFSMQHYMQKTYYKTASLFSNSCKAIAVLADHTNDVSMLAYDYGKNLGLSFQLMDDVLDFTGTSESLGKVPLTDLLNGIVTAPVLFAIEEYPQLREVVERGFDDPAAFDLALEYIRKSSGIQKAKDLAKEHADLAAEAIYALPDIDDEDVRRSRIALVELTNIVITRTK